MTPPTDLALRKLPARTTRTRAVILVLHGGKQVSDAPVRPVQLAYRRMLPFARVMHSAGARLGTAVWVLRNRTRGWNAPRLDALHDACGALETLRQHHPGARIALLGHSMGGRVALHLAAEPDVHAVCALAPWTTEDDPVEHLVGRSVLIVHGARDRTTPPATSLAYTWRAQRAGAGITRHVISGSGHAMLRRWGDWNEHVRGFAIECGTGQDAR